MLTCDYLDLNVDLKTCLIEEYSNEEKPSDGEIYYKMRRYHFQRNFSFEMRWKARLRGKRQQYLLTLTRNEAMTAAFDDLLDIPGLWGGMKITTLHKMMALKCDTVGRVLTWLILADFSRYRNSYTTSAASSRSGPV